MKKTLESKQSKKNDLFLLTGIIGVALLIGLVSYFFIQKPGESVKITIDGKTYGTYSLKEDQTIKIQSIHGSNMVKIQNGKVSVIQANCPDKICVEHYAISKTGETICCLPHKMVVEVIKSKEEAKIDGIAQ